MRPPTHIRMNGHGEAKALLPLPTPILLNEIIKMIHPQLFDDLGVHPAVAVGRFLDEHHGRQVVDVPGGRDFDEAGGLAWAEGVHPGRGGLRVVNLGPGVPDAEIVHLRVVVRHAVVVGYAVGEEELGAFGGGFPPGCYAATWWLLDVV